MTRVTTQDLRAVRYCHAGVRPWFRRHGFDWQDFLAHGIDAEHLRATDDALIEPVIRAAEVRYAAALREAAATQDTPGVEAPDGRA